MELERAGYKMKACEFARVSKVTSAYGKPMSKSRSFSIYLLKQGLDATTALKEEHNLERSVEAADLPSDASLFVLDNAPRPPWWKHYFGIKKSLNQVTKGALLFLPVKQRCFALSFGHVAHNLKDAAYEYDFGLRVTLNCVDPTELRSTDSLDPGVGRRQRTQLPIGGDLTLFDFDHDSSILRRLTGKSKAEHKKLFKHATGASNLRVSTDVPSGGLADLCATLLELYRSEDYKKTFPDIQNISPVRDPLVTAKLNQNLIKAFREKDVDLSLTVPDLVQYEGGMYSSFSGAGRGLIYDEVFIGRLYEYLERRGKELSEICIEELRQYALLITDEDGSVLDRFSVYKSLIFDTELDGVSHHLCEGNWYRVENSYVSRIQAHLDSRWTEVCLPPYCHESEGAYNRAVAEKNDSIVCLDALDISPQGQSKIEPCDLYSIEDGCALFQHVKVSTLSAKLSHLFNQGVNAIELVRLEGESLKKLKALIKEKAAEDQHEALVAPLESGTHHVQFVIVTHKDPNNKSRNLPLFSQIKSDAKLEGPSGTWSEGEFWICKR